jgi:hypothetical protein
MEKMLNNPFVSDLYCGSAVSVDADHVWLDHSRPHAAAVRAADGSGHGRRLGDDNGCAHASPTDRHHIATSEHAYGNHVAL